MLWFTNVDLRLPVRPWRIAADARKVSPISTRRARVAPRRSVASIVVIALVGTTLGVASPGMAQSRRPNSSGSESARPNPGRSARLAAAGAITFSEFPSGTPITSQYRDRGVVFGGDDPYITGDGANPTSPVLSGTPVFQGAIRGTFVVPGSSMPATVSGFSLDVGYINNPGNVAVSYFASNGSPLGQTTADELGIARIAISRPGIAGFMVHAIGEEGYGFAVDNVDFSLEVFEARFVGTGPGQHKVAFTAPSLAGATRYRWSFGDGQTEDGRSVTHTYGTARKVTVRLTVTYPSGPSSSMALDIHTNAAVAFAPRLVFHPDESRMPDSAADFITKSLLKWNRPGCSDKLFARSPSASRLAVGYWSTKRFLSCAATGTAEYRTDQPTRPFSSTVDPDVRQGFYLDGPEGSYSNGELRRAKAYYEKGGRGFRLRYWIFYPYNDFRPLGDFPQQRHEGDWESIEVVLNEQMRISSVIYAQHGCGMTVPVGGFERAAGTHPVVYVAKGSHASYPTTGNQAGPCQVGRDRVATSNRTWDTWAGADLRDVTDESWYGYGGGWGEVGQTTYSTGPAGPPFAQ